MTREKCAMCKQPIGRPPIWDVVFVTISLAFPIVVARLVVALFRVLP